MIRTVVRDEFRHVEGIREHDGVRELFLRVRLDVIAVENNNSHIYKVKKSREEEAVARVASWS